MTSNAGNQQPSRSDLVANAKRIIDRVESGDSLHGLIIAKLALDQLDQVHEAMSEYAYLHSTAEAQLEEAQALAEVVRDLITTETLLTKARTVATDVIDRMSKLTGDLDDEQDRSADLWPTK